MNKEDINFDYKRLHPFKWFILQNYPFLEDSIDVLTNYQLFCKLGEMYNKQVDAINTLGIQVEGLTDWFDNLDLQEEVNNKLDEMAESGELEEIIAAYINTNALICFDTISDLKASTNLVEGSYAKTLGYHNINDDGGATYKIRAITNDDVVDDMFIIELADDSLIGELILEDEININQLGADNTGLVDSSNIFNKAFEKINQNWLNNDNRFNTVTTNGRYLLNSQVIIPPCAKLKGIGFTTILTNVSGSAIKIDYLSTNLPSSLDGNKQDWLQGEIINLAQGGLIKNVGEAYTNTCIEIGRDQDIGVYMPFSRYKLLNFRVYNYAIGILHNSYHNYWGKFENISLESNTTCLQYGVSVKNVVDSGENFIYKDCLFSQCTDCVKWLTDGFDSSFINCSFDFENNVFNDYGNKGYKRISLTNSHLEGFTTLCNKLGQYSDLTFNNCEFVFEQKGNLFANTGNYTQINFSLCKFIPNSQTIYDPEKLLDRSHSALLFNNFYGQGNTYNGFVKGNLISNFDDIADGDVTLTTGSYIGGLKINNHLGNYTAKIETDNYLYTGHKSLVLTASDTSSTTKSLFLESDFIPVSNVNSLMANMFYYNCRGSDQIHYTLYDNKQNQIYAGDYSHFIPTDSNKTPNQWYMSSVGKKLVFPKNAAYVKVVFNILNMANGESDTSGTIYKIGGCIVN